jgi:neuronal calcium sensor 1
MAGILTEFELTTISDQTGIEFSVLRTWYKEFLSECPTGKMDKKHFKKFYKMLRGDTDLNLSKITEHIFASFDNDGSGYLDFSEFIIAYSITTLPNVEIEKKLEFMFLFYVNNIFIKIKIKFE